MLKPHFQLMANYNASMNQKICDSIANLPEATLWEDKKAFFGSILGTLNHLMVGDLIWLHRFNNHPSGSGKFKALEQLSGFPIPNALAQILYDNKAAFISNRQVLNSIIIQFIEETTENDFSKNLTYINTKGILFNKPFSMLLQHFFNHQTHHRGQITTLLSQMNIDIGETDLLMLINDV